MYNVTTKNKVLQYADLAKTTLIFGHGVHSTERKFVVEKDQAVVFLAPISSKLCVRTMTKRFYEIFSNSQKIKDYVSGTLRAIPEFMKGWEKRTYGPGTLCPDLWLDFKDPTWTSMGVIPLPLRTQLRVYSPKTASSLVYLVGTTNVKTDRVHGGTKTWLSPLVKGMKGIVFVIACRHFEGSEVKNKKGMIEHEKAQKILKRKRANENDQIATKKQKLKNQKLENIEKRKHLLKRLETLKKRIRRS